MTALVYALPGIAGIALGVLATWLTMRRSGLPGADVQAWGEALGLEGWTWEFGGGGPLQGHVDVDERRVMLRREPATQAEAFHEALEVAVIACHVPCAAGERRTRRDELVTAVWRLVRRP